MIARQIIAVLAVAFLWAVASSHLRVVLVPGRAPLQPVRHLAVVAGHTRLVLFLAQLAPHRRRWLAADAVEHMRPGPVPFRPPVRPQIRQ